MALHDPKDTLAFFAGRVLCTQRDMSMIPCGFVATAIRKSMAAPGFQMAKPEGSALWFYFLNHGKSIIAQKNHPLEPLSKFDQDFLEKYHKFSNAAVIRAFYYLVLICTRESRHVENGNKLYPEINKKFGVYCTDFNQKITGTGSHGSYQEFLNKAPENTNIGAYCQSLQYIFYEGKFHSSFGGSKWGAIADCLVNFVKGVYSPEMMLDVVWTLCHNGGPIFNKGMFYHDYTHTLYRILDIQRSGQIAEACLTDAIVSDFTSPALLAEIVAFKAAHPDSFGEYVDWYAVEAHGCLHGPYTKEKAVQQMTYGLNEKQLASISETDAKKHILQVAAIEAKKFHAKTHFEYWPGQFVKLKEAPKGREAA